MNIPDLIKQKVVRFIDLEKNLDGGVVFINGEWGTGKTFFWKHLTKDLHIDPIDISLFGIKDLAGIKATIFSAFVAGSDSKSLLGKARSLAAKSNIIKRGAEFAGIDLDIDVVEFINKRKVFCFDDLERLSKEASVEEILGFINYLSEHKAHRCLVIMNITEMNEEHRASLGKLQEKLSMVRIEFGLNVKDRVNSFITAKTTSDCDLNSEKEFVLEEVAKLQVSNLRVIQRILDVLFELKDILKKPIPEDVVKFLISMIVAESKKVQNDFNFYRFNPMKFLMSKDDAGLSDLEKEQKAFHENYFGKNEGYRPYFTVIKLAKHGYVDSSDLSQEIFGSENEKDVIAKRINELKNIHMFFCTDSDLMQLQTEISQISRSSRKFNFNEVATLMRILSSTIKLLEQDLPTDLPIEIRKLAAESIMEVESLFDLKHAFGYRGDDLIEPFRVGMTRIVDNEGLRRATEFLDKALLNVNADLMRKAVEIEIGSLAKCAEAGVIDGIFRSNASEEDKYQIAHVIIEAFQLRGTTIKEEHLKSVFDQLLVVFNSSQTKTEKLRIYRLLEKTGIEITVPRPKSVGR